MPELKVDENGHEVVALWPPEHRALVARVRWAQRAVHAMRQENCSEYCECIWCELLSEWSRLVVENPLV
jgi:hypothetical protein